MSTNTLNLHTMTFELGTPPGDITRILERLAKGDKAAEEQLMPRVYEDLHRLAAFYLSRERSGHSIQATELINEAYLRLAGVKAARFACRAHFFAFAATLMRRILTDYARRKLRDKRGGQTKLALNEALRVSEQQCGMIADLDEALERLAVLDPRAARVVELKFFGGLSEPEIAELLGVTARTVRRIWGAARAWLLGEMAVA